MGALVDRLREYVNRNYSYLVEEVRKLLRIPSISGTGEGIREGFPEAIICEYL